MKTQSIGISACLMIMLAHTEAFLFPSSRSVNFMYNRARNEDTFVLKSGSVPNEDLSKMATERFPTSIEDQIRQAAVALRNAENGLDSIEPIHRHSIRLLLPLIGATELDDWPGGAKQQMEAAAPLVESILKQSPTDAIDRESLSIQSSLFDETDGVQALFAYNENNPKKDSCSILLPTADTVSKIQALDEQVGPNRNLILVNVEWRRPSDFSSSSSSPASFLPFFQSNTEKSSKSDEIPYVESFHPTFICTNLMVEGDQIRILRSYPGPWRVFLQTITMDASSTSEAVPNSNDTEQMQIDWIEIGTKEVEQYNTDHSSSNKDENSSSTIFDYGKPSYQEIVTMITTREGYVPKTVTERAAAAFTFIKDTL